ncbi:hypothetical protein J5X84_33585 [Streptosporangiaceae bacterium NEAU-GS5]|nr:hypothetical protein [Streptosporangiaceae bacterium NEAU-GS5]
MFKVSSTLAVGGLAALLVAAGCGSDSKSATNHGGMARATPAAAPSHSPTDSMGDMPGMDDMPTTDGLSATASGYTLTVSKSAPTAVTFTIRDGQGRPLTEYEPDQTKLMHFYLIRSDLTGFQHVHPTMAPGGTWTAPIQALESGTWRVYATFIPKGQAKPLVLGDKLTIQGKAKTVPLPEPATSAMVDGYKVSVSGDAMAGMAHELGIKITKDGKPADLEPYLGTYAHLTAIHQGDLAFAHLHPHNSDRSNLSVEAMLPKAGNWRLFIQFQTGGTLHTAALTMAVM